MKVLITGGAGFIGSHLVDLHIEKGHEVTVVDDMSTGSLDNLSQHSDEPRLKIVKDSIVTWPALPEVLAEVSLVYHMAAVVGVKHVLENPADVISVNLTATDRLVNSMAALRSEAPVIIASSSEVYGFSGKHELKEDDDVVLPSINRLRWCYAVTKLADEMVAFAGHRQHGLKTIATRLFNTAGVRQSARYGMVLPTFIEEAMSGRPITVFDSGEQTRSLCDVRDTVRMLEELSRQDRAYGEVVNVGTDHEISINDLAKLVKKLTNSSSEITHMDSEDAYGMDFRDIEHRKPDLSQLNGLIEYRPKYELRDTIDHLIAHFRENIVR